MSFDLNLCVDRARQLYAETASDEDLLRFLRQEGASMMESVKLIRIIKDVSLSEAQDLVRLSEAWADQREDHEALQEHFFEALMRFDSED